jgi:nicotinamide mononucleotide transporter
VDAATTVVSLVAQYLLGAKVLETWVLWIAADVVDTGVYLKRRLWATALLYLTLLGLAIMGLVEWMGKL